MAFVVARLFNQALDAFDEFCRAAKGRLTSRD
jgi:hypothetical protein